MTSENIRSRLRLRENFKVTDRTGDKCYLGEEKIKQAPFEHSSFGRDNTLKKANVSFKINKATYYRTRV